MVTFTEEIFPIFKFFVLTLKPTRKSSNFLLLRVILTLGKYIVLWFKKSDKFCVQAAKITETKDLVKESNFSSGDQFSSLFQILFF